MSWVRRTEDAAPAHTCEPPRWYGGYSWSPLGEIGDLWRCDDCAALWRVGNGCDDCDAAGRTGGHCVRGGYHPLSLAWRPATWWQRFRNRRAA